MSRTAWSAILRLIGGIVGTGLTLALTAATLPAQSPAILEVGKFSSAEAGAPFPDPWEPLTFEKITKHTEYSLVEDNGVVVLKAVSRGSSSGLTRAVSIDPKQYPIVEWRWKIENILKNGNVLKKSGDDYPARLYVTFEYDSSKVGFLDRAKYEAARLLYGQYPPGGAINYIWEGKSPVGTIVPNPYTDRARMIVPRKRRGQSGPVGCRVTESLRGLPEGVRSRPAADFRCGRDDGYRQHQRVGGRLLRRHRVQDAATGRDPSSPVCCRAPVRVGRTAAADSRLLGPGPGPRLSDTGRSTPHAAPKEVFPWQ